MMPLSDQDRTEIEAAICAGRKIEAIKLYRKAVAGTDLVDAKKAIEDWETRLRAEHPEYLKASASRSGCLGMVVWMAGLWTAGMLFLSVLIIVWK